MVTRTSLHGATEDGSALLAALVVVVIVYTLFGALLLGVTAQRRVADGERLRRQANYTAEGGVYAAIEQLSRGGAVPQMLVALDGDSAEVEVRTHGAFFLVSSTASAGDRSVRAAALVGADAGLLRTTALGTMGTGLILSGQTRVVGDVRAGGGVEGGTFGGREFSGTFDGTALLGAGLASPSFPLYDQLISDVRARRWTEVARGLPVRVIDGDLVLGLSDAASLQIPSLVVATGRLTVVGPLTFATGSVFVSLDTLDVRGPVDGRHGLFVGVRSVRVASGVSCSGQFVGGQSAEVFGGARLTYPSTVYAPASPTGPTAVLVRSGSLVEGTVIAGWPPGSPAGQAQNPALSVEPSAYVRGALLSGGPVDFRGTVEGSVIAGEFVVTEGYSVYHNWLHDATVDLARRPLGFALPVPGPSLDWERRALITWLPS